MPKLRGLVVDDAVVMRRLLTEALQRDGLIEVAGSAANGRIALQKLTQVNPDFVTLDVEMPEMDGLQTLRELRKTHPRLPVIMFSALTRKGAASTLDALAAGANDYLTKPSEAGNVDEAIAQLQRDLLPKVHAHCAANMPTPIAVEPTVSRPSVPTSALRITAAPELICIGTSTGGPNALADVFRSFPAAPPVPIAIVQHMPPMFTQMLAERLDGIPGPVRCSEAKEGDVLQPGRAYLAPGGYHLSLSRGSGPTFIAHLTEAPPENSCRPAVDVLFRTAALCPAHVLAVVMTGMGQDGLRGCEHVLERQGQVLVQDQATSVIWGMPGAVAQAGLAHAILPLPNIGPEVIRRALRRSP